MSNNFKLLKYSSVKSKEIDWLWYPYIAYGKLTLLQGDPGNGKSLLAIIIASTISNGTNLFNINDFNITSPHKVIYQNAEDSVEDTITPKLEKLNANRDNILYIENDEIINLEDDSFLKCIVENNIKLLILDPIQSFFSKGKSLVNIIDVRQVLKKLSKIASYTNCAIILVGHLNKNERGKDLYRGIGSVDFSAIARSILHLKKSEIDPRIRIIFQVKNSLAKEGNPIAFRINNDGTINWIGEYEDEDIPSINSSNDLVTNIILDAISEEEKSFIEIKEMIGDLASERTLYRIKKRLGIKSIKKNGIWYWQL